MNIRDILKNNGYEIIEQNMQFFKLKYTQEKVEEMKTKYGHDNWPYDLEKSCFNVIVKEVGFDVYGDLYVELVCTGGDDPYFKPGDCFDVIYV